MSREQIEEKHELSTSIYMSGYGLLRKDCDDIAEQLYDEGYRKQSENVIELPCKVGDAVYYVDKGRMKEATVGEITVGRNNNWIIVIEFSCDEDCDGCPFESWSQEYSGEWSCGGEWGTWNVNKDDFGKTVFLSKAEAEAKMKGGAE